MIVPFLLWLAICAYHDFRTGEVSNWLTLPPLGLALAARLLGWLATPWWAINLFWALALYLWYSDRLGGADAKAWLTFSLLGNGILWSAFIGLLIWYAAITWAVTFSGFKRDHRFPGFPGYLLGLCGTILAS